MKLFLHSAIVKEIEWAEERGLIDAIDTNPILLSKTDRRLGEVVRDIIKIVDDRPVCITLVSQTTEDLFDEAKTVAKLGKQVVVSIPMSDAGLAAAKKCHTKGIRTNITLIYSAAQVLLAARAGTTFITVHQDDTKQNGRIIEQTAALFKNEETQPYIIADGIRAPADIIQAAHEGAEAATVPFAVLVQMYRHKATDEGMASYSAHWDKIPK